jgi:peptide subunit release factor 1 (eRF1)
MSPSEALRELLAVSHHDVLSVSLDVDPTRPEHLTVPPAYRIWLRNTLRSTLGALPRGARKTARLSAGRILDYVKTRRPLGRGLAVYAGPQVWLAFELPVPLENRVAYGQPDAWPLMWAVHEFEPYMILAVDRENARISTVYLGRITIEEKDSLDLDVTDWKFKSGRQRTAAVAAGVGASRGVQRDTFDARVDANIRRFWSGVADAAVRVADERHVDRLIIGGPEEAAAAVKSLLPARCQRNVVAVVPLAGWLPEAEVLAHTLPVAKEEQRRRDEALVASVLDGAASGGRAVVGPDATLDALAQGQVDTVVAHLDLDIPAWSCADCSTVVIANADACPACGGLLVPSSLRQILPALTARSAASLRLVRAAAHGGLEDHGGLGALLRYVH